MMHFRFHDVGPRGQGGGARGQNLELPEFFFFLFLNRNNLGRWLVIHLLTLQHWLVCHDGKGRLTFFAWFSDFALYLDTQLIYFLTSFRL